MKERSEERIVSAAKKERKEVAKRAVWNGSVLLLDCGTCQRASFSSLFFDSRSRIWEESVVPTVVDDSRDEEDEEEEEGGGIERESS